MKKASSLMAAFVCVALCCVGSVSMAQQAAAPASNAATQPQARAAKQLIIGVVDLRAIVQAHPIIVDEIPALGMKLQQENLELMKVRQEAEQKINKLGQEYKVGAPEYEDQLASIRKEVSDAQFKANEAQQKIIGQRTQLLFRVYKDLQAAVQTVAVQNGVIIVHSKIKLTPTDDAAVSEEVVALEEADNNSIVWNRPECDLTEAVIKQLTANVGAPKNTQQANNSAPLNNNLGAQALSAAAPVAQPAANPAAIPAARQANPVGAAPRTATAPNNPQRL